MPTYHHNDSHHADYACVWCGKPEDEFEGVIFVRGLKDGRWGSYPICLPCYNEGKHREEVARE